MFKKVAFIGAGSMAEAIIAGIIAKQYLPSEQISVTNKENEDRLNRLTQLYRVKSSSNKEEVIHNADVIVLSMKPKDITEALKDIKEYIKQDQLVVSVLAGVSTEYISEQLENEVPVVRAMPNTSATIGYSATAIAAGRYATEQQVLKLQELFQTIGTTTVVKEEDLHAITGLSGSGPAYIYFLVEALEEAATKAGIEQQTAKDLIVQTLAGAAEMLKVTDLSPAELRERITSPGGTTQAGLETLKRFNYQEGLIECVNEAANRSMELGRPFKVKSRK